MRRTGALLCLTLALLAWPGGARGAESPDHWNLGALGATADLVDGRIVVQRVFAKHPAKGKLSKGDVLVGAGGTALGKAPFQTLGRMLDAAEQSGSIVLEVERAGTTHEVKLKLPKLGTYAGAFTAKNRKLKKIMKLASTTLARAQQGGGVWHSYRDRNTHRGDGITTATVVSALALMAVDPKKNKGAIKAARGFVLSEVRPAEMGAEATSGLHRNWPVALSCLFLAEFHGQNGDKAVRKHLGAMLRRLADNQEATGGWSHFPGFSEGPGYKSLSSLTALALIAQGVALKVGMPVSPESIQKGLDYLEGCVNERGALAYSAVNAATGVQASGRSCGALMAFRLHGRKGPKVDRLRAYVLSHYTDVLESHPAPLTGVWFAAMLAGSWRGESDEARSGFQAKLADHLIPFMTLARHPEGYFVAQPSGETRRVSSSGGQPNADRSVQDPYWATAILLMLHATTNPRLVCLGATPRKR